MRSPGRPRGAAITVALAIDDDDARARAGQAVADTGGRIAFVDAPQCADVIVTDQPDISIGPTVVIGSPPTIDQALARGAAAGVAPSFTADQLRIAIEAAAHGLTCRPAPPEPVPSQATLTARENDVLHELITGASNKEIARRLEITVHTVKFHVAAIVTKLAASGRTDAVARALRQRAGMI